MTPQDTVTVLRTWRNELVNIVDPPQSRVARELPKLTPQQLDTMRQRIIALNTALAMVELGAWVPEERLGTFIDAFTAR